MAPELVILDFDGTLGYRPGRWSQCLVEVLDVHRPGHAATVDDLRPRLRGCFPWHRPSVTRPASNVSDDWWDAMAPTFSSAFAAVGVDVDGELLVAVRQRYCDSSRWTVYPDSGPALQVLASAGVRMKVLSNHVPELDTIIAGLGLDGHFDEIITSGKAGIEKPHPEAFRAALGDVPADRAWMVGDDPIADHDGAVAAGLNAVLVDRNGGLPVDLITAAEMILRR